MEKAIFRGRVDAINGDIITLTMEHGYNYGHKSIAFNMADAHIENRDILKEGAFAEAVYNGMLSRSLPPLANAEKITVIAPFSDGVVVNGRINSAEKRDYGYFISFFPFNSENEIILNAPLNALFDIGEGGLAPGAEISVVTRGISTMSIPPQMPVHAILPYKP